MIELAPSLLAADPLFLNNELQKAADAGVKTLHVDVMDAHFVPNLAFTPAQCAAVSKAFPALILDVHLMMDRPMDYAEAFIKAGAARLTVHVEVLPDAAAAMRDICALGAQPGLSLKPGTPVEALYPALADMHQALIMTVEPGFGGQKLIPSQIEKIKRLREIGFAGDIAVDGGVTLDNMNALKRAGATTLIMGTAFFKAADPRAVAARVMEE